MFSLLCWLCSSSPTCHMTTFLWDCCSKIDKLSTSLMSLFSVCMVSCIWHWILITFVLIVLILRLTLLASSLIIVVLCCMWAQVSEISGTSSAKLRSSNVDVNLHLIPSSPPFIILVITQSTAKRNRHPDILQPGLTPVLISDQLLVPFLLVSALFIEYFDNQIVDARLC